MSEKKKDDAELDETLEESFPSSDPPGVEGGITGDEKPPGPHKEDDEPTDGGAG